MTAAARPTLLRLFPLESTVLFPGMELRLNVFERRYLRLVDECLTTAEPFGIVLLRSGREVGTLDAEPHRVGTTARIEDVRALPGGRREILVRGADRFRVEAFHHDQIYLVGAVRYLERGDSAPVPRPLLAQIRGLVTRYLRDIVAAQGGYLRALDLPEDPAVLSFLVGSLFRGHEEEQQEVLEMDTTEERLLRQVAWLNVAAQRAEQGVKERWSRLHLRRN